MFVQRLQRLLSIAQNSEHLCRLPAKTIKCALAHPRSLRSHPVGFQTPSRLFHVVPCGKRQRLAPEPGNEPFKSQRLRAHQCLSQMFNVCPQCAPMDFLLRLWFSFFEVTVGCRDSGSCSRMLQQTLTCTLKCP